MRIGVLTGGGDCPGLNAVIRAVTKSLIHHGHCEVLGIEDGFEGLMGAAPLPAGSGLLLPRTSSVHTHFMRFPIDVVFLAKPCADGGRRVVSVRPRLRPWTGVVWWARGADGCLELPTGTAAATRTMPGDTVVLEEAAPPG